MFWWLINVAVLVGYFIVANETRAWPSSFIIWAWIPFVAHFVLHHFFDGVQNATRNIARIYLLERDGLIRTIIPKSEPAEPKPS